MTRASKNAINEGLRERRILRYYLSSEYINTELINPTSNPRF